MTGPDLHGRTVGVVGTGAIGTVFARIMTGFGCARCPMAGGRIGHLGIDVYEEESALFFEDRSERGAFDDDLFARLLTFPNVLVTGTRDSSPKTR